MGVELRASYQIHHAREKLNAENFEEEEEIQVCSATGSRSATSSGPSAFAPTSRKPGSVTTSTPRKSFYAMQAESIAARQRIECVAPEAWKLRQQRRKIQCRARLLQRHHQGTSHLLRTIQVVWRSFDTAFCKSRRCLHQATLPGTDHTALRLRRGVLPRHFHNTWHNRHRNRRRDTTRVFRPRVVSASKMEFGALYQGRRD